MITDVFGGSNSRSSRKGKPKFPRSVSDSSKQHHSRYDTLAEARGIILGVALSLVLWAALGISIYAWLVL